MRVSLKYVFLFLASPGLIVSARGAVQVATQAPGPDEFFETRVRPVLSERCFSCHGELGSGGLRLDSKEAMLKGGKSGPAIVAGDPDSSLLIKAVSHTLESLKMPLGAPRLKEEEIASLKAWVKMGAPWPDSSKLPPATKNKEFFIKPEQRAFWSFQPCHKPAIPQVQEKNWPKSPLDNFILARLEAQGLQPVRPAEKRVLLRRAYFDLVGLPPRPEEVAAFLADESPDAFARVIDRLLASPHYGERWGRHWLDVARYGEDDVRGLQQETYANAWRYRDWVIQAFNDDMPYDVFVKAQIAGDLLPEKEKLVAATGFWGLGPWYYDLVEPPQARADERHDRVDALTRGFLGLTVACARCHNHKYDPVSMQDYYALAGVVASSDYHEYPLVPASVVADYQKHEKKITDLEARIKEFSDSQSEQLANLLAWKTARYVTASWKVLRGPKLAPAQAAEEDKLDVETLEKWVKYLSNPQKDHPYLKAWQALFARDGTLDEARQVADEFQATLLALLAEKKQIDEENRVILAQNKPAKDALEVHLPNGFATYEDFCPGCFTATKPMERNKFLLWRDLFTEEDHFEDPAQKNGGVLVYKGEKLERFLSGEWKSHLDSMRAELETLKKNKPPPYPFLHGLAESSKPANLKLHLRGSPYNLGEEVPRRFIAVLSEGDPAPFTKGSGRLELAEDIARHPLAARVMVNRVWQRHFGFGLARTASNFGRLGDPPSHPELLEYLTSRFIEHRFSIKELHREIMLSAVYQLSSDFAKKNYAEDPDNRLLWRANRRRLDAEALRDSLLYVTGNLDLALGGPSAELTDDYKRRTVYGKVSRFQLNTLLALFDFPPPSITSEQRNVTNVPLQKLFFMNSGLLSNQAGALASNLSAGADRAKIENAYRLLFGRAATDAEVKLGLDFLRSVESDAAAPPPAVAVVSSPPAPAMATSPPQIAGAGFKPAPASAGSGTVATASSVPPKHPSPWQQYAQVLLSSNEFMFVD